MIKNYHIVKDIKLKAKSFTMSCLEYPFLNICNIISNINISMFSLIKFKLINSELLTLHWKLPLDLPPFHLWKNWYIEKCLLFYRLKLISSNQSGFKFGGSWVYHFLSFTHRIYEPLDSGMEVRVYRYIKSIWRSLARVSYRNCKQMDHN